MSSRRPAPPSPPPSPPPSTSTCPPPRPRTLRDAGSDTISKPRPAHTTTPPPHVSVPKQGEFKPVFNPIRDPLPNASSAVNYVIKALGFDKLIRIPDLTGAISSLQTSATELESVGSNLPQAVVDDFKAVRKALDAAVDEAFSDVDPTALLRGLGQIKKAIDDHPQ